jgi:FtsZ-binding cell division protein ZapB
VEGANHQFWVRNNELGHENQWLRRRNNELENKMKQLDERLKSVLPPVVPSDTEASDV